MGPRATPWGAVALAVPDPARLAQRPSPGQPPGKEGPTEPPDGPAAPGAEAAVRARIHRGGGEQKRAGRGLRAPRAALGPSGPRALPSRQRVAPNGRAVSGGGDQETAFSHLAA